METINIKELIPVADSRIEFSEDYLTVSGMGYVRTKEYYKVPLRISLTAMTDSHNIRLHFAKGQIIMLWEEDLNILPFHEPIFGHDYKISGIEKLSKNEWIQCTWIITGKYMKIIINDKEVFSHSIEDKVITLGSGMPWIIPNCNNLNGYIGVGPAWGSRVTVKKLEVEEM